MYGTAGIGKSRLTNEFVSAVRARHPAATVLRGRCLAAGHGITYWALAEVLRGIIEVGLADPVEEVRRRLAERIGPMLDLLGLPPPADFEGHPIHRVEDVFTQQDEAELTSRLRTLYLE